MLDLAALELERDRIEPSERRALEALRPLAEVGDRQNLVYAFALLADLAARSGRRARAGRLWGAIEAEEARGPIGAWAKDREEAERLVLAAAGPDFDAARAEGRVLALDEAIEFAVTSS